jgi:hypothetical protein
MVYGGAQARYSVVTISTPSLLTRQVDLQER